MAAALRRLMKKKQDDKVSSELKGAASCKLNEPGNIKGEAEDGESVDKKTKQVSKSKKSKDDNNKRQVSRPEVRTKRLMREFLQLSQNTQCSKPIFAVELVEDSLFEWHVKLFSIDPDSPLQYDMNEMGLTFISLNLSFPDNFPFSPPFMRVVRPKIEGGFVLDGGAICMELLTPSGWSSAYTVEAMIMQFAALVVKGKGRIDKTAKGDFTKKDAESSFKKLVKTHERYGWITPPISEG
eukprot:gene18757-20648_t